MSKKEISKKIEALNESEKSINDQLVSRYNKIPQLVNEAKNSVDFLNKEVKTEQITLKIKTNLLDKIKQIARKLSFEEQKDILYTDLIRLFLEEKTNDFLKEE